jgi:transcription elongation factor Elf1
MADEIRETSEVKESDIVFDCPHCGKSLAIDYRGAGLTIPCSDCGNTVEVPIPDGMQLADIDSGEEEQEMLILNLRRSVAGAEARVKQLEAEIDELNSRRETLEKSRSNNIYQFGQILEKVGVMQKLLKQMADNLEKVAEVAKEAR